MKACYELIRRERVAVVQAHEFDANIHGSLVAAAAGIPIVGTIHGKVYFHEKVRRRWAYRVASHYAQFVVVSEDLRQFVERQTGISRDCLHVIPNGIGELNSVDHCRVADLRRELEITHTSQVVGVVGNLYPVKGHEYLINAIPKILLACPGTVFLFIGRGELEEKLRIQVDKLGVSRYVRFLGLRRDIPELLTLMDVFAMPSLSEGLSIALLEAMRAGKPVVTTSVGGNVEVVVGGQTGLLVPPADSHALGDALIKLLLDADMGKQFGLAGRQRVCEQFTLEGMQEKYERLYHLSLARSA